MGLTHEAYKSNTENIKVVKKAMTAWNRNVVLLALSRVAQRLVLPCIVHDL